MNNCPAIHFDLSNSYEHFDIKFPNEESRHYCLFKKGYQNPLLVVNDKSNIFEFIIIKPIFNERTDIAERVEKEFPERMGDSIVMDFKATSGARIKDPTLEVLEEKTRGELDIYRAEEHEMWKACRAMKKGFFESKEKFKEREKEAEQEIQEHKQNELKLFFYKEDKTGISDLSNAYSGIRNHVDKMLTWTLGGGHYNEQWENFFKEKERTLGGIIDFCKQYAQEKFEKTKLTPEEEKLLELEKTVKERRHWAS